PGGDVRQVLLNGEAVLPEDAGEVLRGLELLEAQLGEAEHLVVHALDHLAEAVDLEPDVALVLIEAWIGWSGGRVLGVLRLLREWRDHDRQHRHDGGSEESRRAQESLLMPTCWRRESG